MDENAARSQQAANEITNMIEDAARSLLTEPTPQPGITSPVTSATACSSPAVPLLLQRQWTELEPPLREGDDETLAAVNTPLFKMIMAVYSEGGSGYKS
jgi:hypothetical protein